MVECFEGTRALKAERYSAKSFSHVFSRRFSIKGKMPDYSSDCFFSSDYNPHTDRSTFLTNLTILKSYNSYLANLKYWRKCRRRPPAMATGTQWPSVTTEYCRERSPSTKEDQRSGATIRLRN